MFKLDSRLEADCFVICDLEISRLLLMNDANYLWLILVPRQEGLVEIADLAFDDQVTLLQEINQLSKILKSEFKVEKLNIAALGNMVKQLHIHVIGRFSDDVSFPKPVWGVHPAQEYKQEKIEQLVARIRGLLDLENQENYSKENYPETLFKQLLYRATHRGCKETDFLIGEFAKQNLKKMTAGELKLFAEFLEEDDLRIYDWVLGKYEVDDKYLAIIQEIRGFCGV